MKGNAMRNNINMMLLALNENVTVLEKLETFLDSTYIVLNLEERMKQEGK